MVVLELFWRVFTVFEPLGAIISVTPPPIDPKQKPKFSEFIVLSNGEDLFCPHWHMLTQWPFQGQNWGCKGETRLF